MPIGGGGFGEGGFGDQGFGAPPPPPSGNATVIQSAIAGPSPNTSYSLQFGSNVVAGDLLIVKAWCGCQSPVSIHVSDDQGNVYTQDVNGAANDANFPNYWIVAGIFRAIAGTGGVRPIISVSFTGATVILGGASIAEYPLAAATPLDTSSADGNNGAVGASTAALTTGHNSEIVISLGVSQGGGGSSGSGWTTRDTWTLSPFSALGQDQGAPAAGTPVASTRTGAQTSVVLLVAYRLNPATFFSLGLSDTISPADSITKRIFTFLGDLVTPADTTLARLGAMHAGTEVFTLSETRVLRTSKVSGDTATPVESLVRSGSHSYLETGSIVDSLANSSARLWQETVSIVESAGRTFARKAAEVFALADGFLKTPALLLNEALILVELIERFAFRVLAESLTPSDLLKRAAARLMADALSLLDAIFSGGFRTFQTFLDNSVYSDSLSNSSRRLLTDLLPVVNVVAGAISLHMGDLDPPTDSVQPRHGVTVSDTVSTSDSLRKRISRSFGEVLSWIESLLGRWIPGLGFPREIVVPTVQRAFIVDAVVTAFRVPAVRRAFVAEEDAMLYLLKHPGSTEDFDIDLSGLSAIAIDSISVPAVSGLTIADQGATLPLARIRIGGGVAGQLYLISLLATMHSGEIKVVNLTLRVALVIGTVNATQVPVEKDPRSNENFQLDWTPALGDDVVVSSSWQASPPVPVTHQSFDGVSASAWLGPSGNGRFPLTNTVTTARGQIKACDLFLLVAAQ